MSEVIPIQCPSCGVSLEAPADVAGRKVKCSQCNTKMEVPVAPEESPVSAGSPDQPACVSCGGSIEPDVKFCPSCGEAQGQACPQCGDWLKPGQKFCPSCGMSADQAENFDQEPRLTIKPKALPLMVYLACAIVGPQLFLLIFIGAGAGIAIASATGATGLGFFGVIFGAVFGGVPLLIWGSAIVSAFLTRKYLEKCEYRFYDTRLEYYDGFGTINFRTIPYAQIDGVQAKQGWLFEKRYGVGDLSVRTLTEGEIVLNEVPDFENNYRQVSDIMSQFSMTGGRQVAVGNINQRLAMTSPRRRHRPGSH